MAHCVLTTFKEPLPEIFLELETIEVASCLALIYTSNFRVKNIMMPGIFLT